LTDKEIDNYIPGYMEEGRFDRDGNLKIFPFAKSTEVLLLNKTDWDKYAAETGANIDQLKTFEGLTETAKKYYEWSGGKAFLGRDAFANYMIIGSKQLGTEIFEVKDGTVHVNLDEKIMRQLWDNYYVPYINGYFVSNGRFASDDAKTGSVIAVVGSTSSATYFPTKVTISDTENYQIETMVLGAPVFNEGKRVAVQQGAGMVVTKSDERREDAAAVFLKWLTEPDHNINFSITSGYLPVTIEANKKDRIKAEIEKSGEAVISDTLKKTLSAAVDTTNNSELYTNKAFEKGTEARAVLENSMKDKAKADRAAVEALIKSGVSTQEAAAQFDTDDNFKQWFNRLRNDLDKAVQ
ncbi:MAG: extracellular solute-binding protein, partial [Eubacterium sp.]